MDVPNGIGELNEYENAHDVPDICNNMNHVVGKVHKIVKMF